MRNDKDKIFTPIRLGALLLKNRTIKAATYEGRSPKGALTDDLIEWHREIAKGGVGMTTLAYCAVSEDGRSFKDQIHFTKDLIPALQRFASTMHDAGAAASAQLTHCGYFTKNKKVKHKRPLGPSFVINNYGIFSGLPFGYAMKQKDIISTVDHFATAAVIARESGFDAVEVHAGHGYLLSQFLSPKINRRKDAFGGSIENRARITQFIIRAIREKTGSDYPIIVKMNLSDGFKGGLTIEDAVAFAKILENEGANALELSGGFTSKTPFFLLRGERPLKEMIQVEKNRAQKMGMRIMGPSIIKEYPFEEMFFLDLSRRIRKKVVMPLILLGGIVSRENMNLAMQEGFDMVALGRPLIHDPEFVDKIQNGTIDRSGCIPCNKCIPEMDRGGIRCVLLDPNQ